MSINIGNINAVAIWLSNITIPGLTIVDLYGLPEAVNPQDAPLLVPDVNAPFVQNFSVTRVSFRDSVGGRIYQVRYTLNYVLYYGLLSEGVSLFEAYPDMVDMWSNVVTALVKQVNETPTGAYDMTVSALGQAGVVTDPIGAQFHGAKFSISVLEHATGE